MPKNPPDPTPRPPRPVGSSWHNRLDLIGTTKEKVYILENLAMLLGSGMDVTSALKSIRTDLKSDRLRKRAALMEEMVSNGSSLGATFRASGLFSQQAITLVELGEATGKLLDNMKLIVAEEEKERSLRSKLRSAMAYPVLVLGLTAAVGVGIAWFILPRLAGVFKSLRLNLPLPTRILIFTGTFLQNYGLIALPVGIVILVVLTYFLFFQSRTKSIGQFIVRHIPGIGPLVEELELARFGYMMGSLLGAGVPVVEAMRSVEQAASFRNYRKFYGYLRISLEEGNSFRRSLEEYPSKRIIPTPVRQLIAAGEQGGKLSEIFLKIGERYEEKTDAATKDLAVVLEPVLLVIVWVAVLFVALSVILPIYSLLGGLNNT